MSFSLSTIERQTKKISIFKIEKSDPVFYVTEIFHRYFCNIYENFSKKFYRRIHSLSFHEIN